MCVVSNDRFGFNVSRSLRTILSPTPKKVASVALVSIMFSRTFSRTFHCPVSIMRFNKSLWRSANSSRTFSRTSSRTSVSFCKLFALFLRNVTLTPPSTSHNYPFEIFANIALFSESSMNATGRPPDRRPPRVCVISPMYYSFGERALVSMSSRISARKSASGA